MKKIFFSALVGVVTNKYMNPAFNVLVKYESSKFLGIATCMKYGVNYHNVAFDLKNN
jgi:predicted porin